MTSTMLLGTALVLVVLCVTEAKVFDRCEFAAELQSLGARDDMLADCKCSHNFTVSTQFTLINLL